MNRFEMWLSRVSADVLIFVGLLGAAIGIANVLGWRVLSSQTRAPLYIVLALVGLLCLSLGLERAIHFRSLNKQWEDIETERVQGALGGQHLKSYNDVYDNYDRLCAQAQDQQIRALSFATSSANHIKTPRKSAETTAKILSNGRRKRHPINLVAVIGLDFAKLANPTYLADMNDRYKIYQTRGVVHLAIPYLLDNKNSFGLDMYIIDRKHLLLGHTIHKPIQDVQRGILFENHPVLASEFADWFDQRVLGPAVQPDKWLADEQGINDIGVWAQQP